jgi:hypothetical protein
MLNVLGGSTHNDQVESRVRGNCDTTQCLCGIFIACFLTGSSFLYINLIMNHFYTYHQCLVVNNTLCTVDDQVTVFMAPDQYYTVNSTVTFCHTDCCQQVIDQQEPSWCQTDRLDKRNIVLRVVDASDYHQIQTIQIISIIAIVIGLLACLLRQIIIMRRNALQNTERHALLVVNYGVI